MNYYYHNFKVTSQKAAFQEGGKGAHELRVSDSEHKHTLQHSNDPHPQYALPAYAGCRTAEMWNVVFMCLSYSLGHCVILGPKAVVSHRSKITMARSGIHFLRHGL